MNQQSDHEARKQSAFHTTDRSRQYPWRWPRGHQTRNGSIQAVLRLVEATGTELERSRNWSSPRIGDPLAERLADEEAFEWIDTALEDIAATLTGITLSRGDTPYPGTTSRPDNSD